MARKIQQTLLVLFSFFEKIGMCYHKGGSWVFPLHQPSNWEPFLEHFVERDSEVTSGISRKVLFATVCRWWRMAALCCVLVTCETLYWKGVCKGPPLSLKGLFIYDCFGDLQVHSSSYLLFWLSGWGWLLVFPGSPPVALPPGNTCSRGVLM